MWFKSGTDTASSHGNAFVIMVKRMFITDFVKGQLAKLKGAFLLTQENISGDFTTMISRTRLKELAAPVTYPRDAHHASRKISVFSPIGIAYQDPG